MASQGQNFLNYTEEEKNEIIQKYCNGETSGYQLAKQYGIPVLLKLGNIKLIILKKLQVIKKVVKEKT